VVIADLFCHSDSPSGSRRRRAQCQLQRMRHSSFVDRAVAGETEEGDLADSQVSGEDSKSCSRQNSQDDRLDQEAVGTRTFRRRRS
jgi:hypothetical protein